MADASCHASFSNLPPPSGPRDWREAFAALPQDAPDASRWPAIERTLAQAAAARNIVRARRRRIGLALAAGLCALALLPFALRRPVDIRPPAAADTPRSASTAASHPTQRTPAPSTTPREASAPVAVADTHPQQATPPRLRTARPAPPHERRRALATRRDATSTPRTVATAMEARADVPANGTTAAAEDSLDTLYAASAQLEALLTLTRDPRVDSGPAAALAGGYDAEIAAVDAQLAQPALSADEQRRLWRARVDLLQQATGLESQLRVLAASGRRLDGALVRVD